MSDTSEEIQTHNPLFVDDNTTFETLEIKTTNVSEQQIANEKKHTLVEEKKKLNDFQEILVLFIK